MPDAGFAGTAKRKGDDMFSQEQMMEIIQKRRGDSVVVTVERASVAWPKISTKPTRDVSPTVMGKGSSFTRHQGHRLRR